MLFWAMLALRESRREVYPVLAPEPTRNGIFKDINGSSHSRRMYLVDVDTISEPQKEILSIREGAATIQSPPST